MPFHSWANSADGENCRLKVTPQEDEKNYMVLGNSFNNSIAIQEKLVHDLLNLKDELDTKETNFFLSSLLTGKL